MKFTPNKSPDLLGAEEEIKAVSNVFLSPSSHLIKTLGNPKSIFTTLATRKAVVSVLRTCKIAHFACHAEAFEDPLHSRIYLQDWKPRPLSVSFIIQMDFDNCQLVNLFDCETAVN